MIKEEFVKFTYIFLRARSFEIPFCNSVPSIMTACRLHMIQVSHVYALFLLSLI